MKTTFRNVCIATAVIGTLALGACKTREEKMMDHPMDSQPAPESSMPMEDQKPMNDDSKMEDSDKMNDGTMSSDDDKSDDGK